MGCIPFWCLILGFRTFGDPGRVFVIGDLATNAVEDRGETIAILDDGDLSVTLLFVGWRSTPVRSSLSGLLGLDIRIGVFLGGFTLELFAHFLECFELSVFHAQIFVIDSIAEVAFIEFINCFRFSAGRTTPGISAVTFNVSA